MSLVNKNDAAGHSVFSNDNHGSYHIPEFAVVKRDKDGIPIDPNYKPKIINYHYVDRGRLSWARDKARKPGSLGALSDYSEDKG